MPRWWIKILSHIVRRPVDMGYGISCDDVKSVKQPVKYNPKNLLFFRLRRDLGGFEIQKVKHNKDGSVVYKVYHAASNEQMWISQKWFEFLFEEVPIEHNTKW